MITSKELVKKGRVGKTIASLDITQVGAMTIRVGVGPVFWQGEDYTLDTVSDYELAEDPDPRFVAIYLVKRKSDGQCVVFVDEDTIGEPGYDFAGSSDYTVMYKLAEIRVAAGATSLDEATMFMRRWVDKEPILAEQRAARRPTPPTEEEIAARQAVIDERRAARAAALAEAEGGE